MTKVENIKLYQGDCLELMKEIPNKSVDMILCDLPQKITHNFWDCIIDPVLMWEQYKRVIKDNGAIVLFANNMFTAQLMFSNPKMWRYNLIWNKVLSSGFLNANRMPMRVHEDICVFYKKLPEYHPQKFDGGKQSHSKGLMKKNTNNNYGNFLPVESEKTNLKHPLSILTFQKVHPSKCLHPTQKPVALLEYLIKTYTNESEIVLDNCMGSGSTGVACQNTNRKFIGMELDEKYFNVAKERIINNTEKQDI